MGRDLGGSELRLRHVEGATSDEADHHALLRKTQLPARLVPPSTAMCRAGASAGAVHDVAREHGLERPAECAVYVAAQFTRRAAGDAAV